MARFWVLFKRSRKARRTFASLKYVPSEKIWNPRVQRPFAGFKRTSVEIKISIFEEEVLLATYIVRIEKPLQRFFSETW